MLLKPELHQGTSNTDSISGERSVHGQGRRELGSSLHFLEHQSQICAKAGLKWGVNSQSGSITVNTTQGGSTSAGLFKALLWVAENSHSPNVLPHHKTNALLRHHKQLRAQLLHHQAFCVNGITPSTGHLIWRHTLYTGDESSLHEVADFFNAG